MNGPPYAGVRSGSRWSNARFAEAGPLAHQIPTEGLHQPAPLRGMNVALVGLDNEEQ